MKMPRFEQKAVQPLNENRGMRYFSKSGRENGTRVYGLNPVSMRVCGRRTAMQKTANSGQQYAFVAAYIYSGPMLCCAFRAGKSVANPTTATR
jgi:hypothetical protein